MKLINRTGLFLSIFLGMIFSSRAEDVRQVVLCSGTTVKINATNYFTTSAFLWQKFENGNWQNLSASGPSADFSGSSLSVKFTDVRCILSNNKLPYDTLFYRVKIMPVPVISKISADQLCIGKLSHFDFTSPTSVTNQKWTFNLTDTMLQKSATYLIKTEGNLRVMLNVSNEAGCSASKDTAFKIASLPYISIQRERLVHPDFYFEKVGCGNDSTLFNFVSQGSGTTLTRWYVTYNGVVVYEKALPGGSAKTDQKYIKRANITGSTLNIIWNNLSEASEFQIGADYSVNQGCVYAKSISVIILPFKTPEKGIIHLKPNNSKVLIYKPLNKDSDTTLNYQWGYTANGEDIQAGTNRFFNQFSDVNTKDKYWVETYFSDSKECRSRTYFLPGKTKSVEASSAVLRVYPNPANDYVKISISGGKTGTIYLIDIYGNKLKSLPVSSTDEFVWNFNQMNPGNYLVVFEDHSGTLISEKLSITY